MHQWETTIDWWMVCEHVNLSQVAKSN